MRTNTQRQQSEPATRQELDLTRDPAQVPVVIQELTVVRLSKNHNMLTEAQRHSSLSQQQDKHWTRHETQLKSRS
jgi:hypothetical protein